MTTFNFQASGTREELNQQLEDQNNRTDQAASGEHPEGTSLPTNVPEQVWQAVEALLDWLTGQAQQEGGPSRSVTQSAQSVHISGVDSDDGERSCSIQVHNR